MFTILKACLLTVLIETVLFYLFGYRTKDDITIVACANAVTNLSLNLILAICGARSTYWNIVVPLELAVVLAEFLIYARAFGPSRLLFWRVLAANALSFGIGLLLF